MLKSIFKINSLATCALAAAFAVVAMLALPLGAHAEDAMSEEAATQDYHSDIEPFDRISGNDRYGTALEVAKWFATYNPSSLDNLVVATGEDYADALCASSFAGQMNCAVMLSDPDYVPDGLKSFISDHDIKNIYVIGGESAISEEVFSELQDTIGADNVVRICGDDRIGTAGAICAKKTGEWADTCIVVRGFGSAADALSSSAYAYAAKCPIFLTDEQGNLTDATKNVIKSEGFKKVVIVGGVSAVSADSEQYLNSMMGDSNVMRIAGADRYETSRDTVLWAEGNSADAEFQPTVTLVKKGMSIVSGKDKNYPDGLVGGVLSGSRGKAIMLIDPDAEDGGAAVRDLLLPNKGWWKRGDIIGGYSAVPEELERNLRNILCQTES